MSHFNLNYHAKAFEQADSYLHNAVKILSKPPKFFQTCVTCAKEAIVGMPGYLDGKLDEFYE